MATTTRVMRTRSTPETYPGAIVVCGLGYAEGARLSRHLGGWQVISWALVLSLPIMAVLTLLTLPASFGQVGGDASTQGHLDRVARAPVVGVDQDGGLGGRCLFAHRVLTSSTGNGCHAIAQIGLAAHGTPLPW